jgi:hypothetical protein
MMRTFLQNKPIFILLFIFTNINMHAMELVLTTPELMHNITIQLYTNHQNVCECSQDIKSFSKTNKLLHILFNQEKIQQNIFILYKNYKGVFAAWSYSPFPALQKKCLNDFTKDPWYLNNLPKYFKLSLPYEIITAYRDFTKAQQIIQHMPNIEFDYTPNRNLLLLVARLYSCVYIEEKPILLSIAKVLLDRKMLPDKVEANEPSHKTSLIIAVGNTNEKLTRLLLEYEANPYLQIQNPYIRPHNASPTQQYFNAFDYECEPGWLQKIIDEVAKEQQEKL